MATHPYLQWAKEAISIEQEAIRKLGERLDDTFTQACERMLACEGRIIVTGMGKSGHIGRKIAATLASTGTPAFFVHPGEASHGDLGMITAKDLVIAISYSGETSEVTSLLSVIKRIGATLVGISRNPASTLGHYSDVHLNVEVEREACPHNLAPTTSTTATLVLGDALAIALLQAQAFSANDFALSHPGGSLGRRLLLTLKDVMHTGERIPNVKLGASVSDALLEMSQKGLGMTAITDSENRLQGVFTDGDLRRILDDNINIKEASIDKLMTADCIAVSADMLAAEALKLMEEKRINGLIIVDSGHKPIGAMNMHDLLRSGVV